MTDTKYYNASDISKLLGVSTGTAYRIIRQCDDKLTKEGFIIIAGKVPKKYIREHYYGDEKV